MPAGRPTTYTPEQGKAICAWIANGKSLRSWCAENDIDQRIVFDWLDLHPEFSQQYAQARERQADGLSDEVMDLARQEDEDPRAAKARADILLAVQSRLAPKRYGTSRIGIGQDPDAGPVKIELVYPDEDSDPEAP